MAGPQAILSMVITSAICFLTCLPYAEFASIIPSAGSAYAFVY